ncbi:phosphoribosylanthranilate isomerase [Wenzhouxiangella sp. XN79A]|uniref:phosphoribosylanthranilate isomerase n=1 Tax=Wenzhouxiangella sp. XN79A TaxID=2724193 RepID=UPI00144A905F|nr:phosphoribosylanthranilate isomerase [Wenzhouxiangella sp. XN79A]NKI35913.1 phosphoribosylanthranilate isomerase [Wenzhouxiangella sp. XN79A]
MRTRVKICGITRPDDGRQAAELGADAIGLVFVPRSPRNVDAALARAICAALPPLTGAVGLFMNAEPALVRAVLDEVPLNWLQFHGDEPAAYCRSFDRPYIKALPMGSPDAVDYADWPDASALLLDAHAAGGMGGSGQRLDWSVLTPPDRPWILAGGLAPDNVAEAVRALGPPAVDVSSGVESAPGIKSGNLMNQFLRGVSNG